MLAFAVLAAAAVAKHAAVSGGSISDSAYPLEARKGKIEGRSVVAFVVDEAGKPKDCRTLASSGSDLLDAATCKLAAGLRFRAARDDSGKPVGELFNFSIVWTLPKNLQVFGPSPADKN